MENEDGKYTNIIDKFGLLNSGPQSDVLREARPERHGPAQATQKGDEGEPFQLLEPRLFRRARRVAQRLLPSHPADHARLFEPRPGLQGGLGARRCRALRAGPLARRQLHRVSRWLQ